MAKVHTVLKAIARLREKKEELGQEGYWNVYRKLRLEFYKSRAWRELAERVRKEQKNYCGVCKRKTSLDVHHILFIYDHPEKALYRPNLIGLCRKCHDKVHDRTLILKVA